MELRHEPAEPPGLRAKALTALKSIAKLLDPMSAPAPIRLLVVDDNDANRYALSRLLLKKGAKVDEATNGDQALQMAATLPSAILMDIHLPDMTAYTVLEKLRKSPATAALPVILMSAVEPAPHARAMAESLGVHSFLTLPVLPDDLWIVVQAALHRHSRSSL
jgi:CheY-like chemotaxis protein